jgi:hypothetical protein
MKYYQRRSEIGKMLVDIAKYIATIVIIGGLFTEKLTSRMALLELLQHWFLLLIAFFTIPPNGEG